MWEYLIANLYQGWTVLPLGRSLVLVQAKVLREDGTVDILFADADGNSYGYRIDPGVGTTLMTEGDTAYVVGIVNGWTDPRILKFPSARGARAC